jgi:hypothetical protein
MTRVVSPSTEESSYYVCGPFGGFCNLELDVFEQGRPGGQPRLKLLDERGGLLQHPGGMFSSFGEAGGSKPGQLGAPVTNLTADV